jgi:hypothetical protein
MRDWFSFLKMFDGSRESIMIRYSNIIKHDTIGKELEKVFDFLDCNDESAIYRIESLENKEYFETSKQKSIMAYKKGGQNAITANTGKSHINGAPKKMVSDIKSFLGNHKRMVVKYGLLDNYKRITE